MVNIFLLFDLTLASNATWRKRFFKVLCVKKYFYRLCPKDAPQSHSDFQALAKCRFVSLKWHFTLVK